MRKYFLLLLFVTSSLNSVVILVHGTFANSYKWCRPGGDFYQQLERQALRLNHKVIPFTWTGGLSDSDRVQGAEALAKVILSYPSNEEKVIIGHSHGGNVATLATKILETTSSMCNPTRKDKWALFAENLFASFFNHKNIPPKSKDSTKLALTRAISSVYEMQKVQTRGIKDYPDYLVSALYLIGTPIDRERYGPHMSIVRNVYNLYSKGDAIQPVLGFYKRLILNTERKVNFRITIEDSGLFDDDPSHSEIHDKMIAKWLLDIPLTLSKNKLYGFENFDPKRNGKIHFDQDGNPHFKVDKRTTEEREAKEANRQSGYTKVFYPEMFNQENTRKISWGIKEAMNALSTPPLWPSIFHT